MITTGRNEMSEIKIEKNDYKNEEERQFTETSELKLMESSNEIDYVELSQRLKAEFDNYKKRVENQRAELSNLLKGQLIYKLLPLIDDFERMIQNSQSENSDIFRGSCLIYQKLMDILKDEGLQEMEGLNKKFDPEIHEAVQVQTIEDNCNNKVLEVIQKGYFFNTQLLRTAKVRVGLTKRTTVE